jgi:hypothetical protein
MPGEEMRMKKGGWWLALLLGMLLSLAACRSTFDIEIEDGRTTAASATGPVRTTGTPDATEQVAAMASATREMSPTAPETETPQPTSTATSHPTATPTETLPPTERPTATPPPTATSPPATAAPSRARILSFRVTPAEANPGDTVTLIWEAEGDRAMLCPTARYVLFTRDDCRPVPVSGTTAFGIPPEVDGFQTVDFTLEVETLAPETTATAQTSVALKCDRTWFFSDAPQAGICPREPLRSYAAAQHFERGLMIWMEEPGRYYILEEARQEGTDRKMVQVIQDPLQIVRDSSQGIKAPQGYHVPVSGFGLVWRGDVQQSPGYRQRLGWALEPEFGYEAILQCDDARPSGGRSWQTCALRGPDGEVILLHPLGGWTLLAKD